MSIISSCIIFGIRWVVVSVNDYDSSMFDSMVVLISWNITLLNWNIVSDMNPPLIFHLVVTSTMIYFFRSSIISLTISFQLISIAELCELITINIV